MLQIYDSLRQSKQPFVPVKPAAVSMYVCGMTVYDHCHVGHCRGFVVFDVVKRYLTERGYAVTLVRNITDIDDKIIDRANAHGESSEDWAERFIESTDEDIAALGILPPDHEPRATQYLAEIITLIETLIEKEAAYVASNGDVCFSVRSFKDYGKLSNRDIDQLQAGTRIETSDAKRDPLDFVLWKLAKPGEPYWASPWGDGRPGWHIECSAMAGNLLGQPFDIHGGGIDLKFPHHENEIAQSEAACGEPFCNNWMHVGLVQVNNEKMSKSLGNFFTIKDVLTSYHPEVLRYFMISAHYRSPISYSRDLMEANKQALSRLYIALRGLPTVEAPLDQTAVDAFHAAMDDDFNTPEALSVMFALARDINSARDAGEPDKAATLAVTLRFLGTVLGVLQSDPTTFLQGGSVDAERVDALIAERQAARANKEFTRSDEIRDELVAMGVVIEDDADGTTWRVE